jgi:hypothetical protein
LPGARIAGIDSQITKFNYGNFGNSAIMAISRERKEKGDAA